MVGRDTHSLFHILLKKYLSLVFISIGNQILKIKNKKYKEKCKIIPSPNLKSEREFMLLALFVVFFFFYF
jgi:hypothetical protein